MSGWSRDDDAVIFQLIDPSGEADGAAMTISDEAITAVDPAITWTGSEFGLSWYDTRYLETEGNWIFMNRIGFCE